MPWWSIRGTLGPRFVWSYLLAPHLLFDIIITIHWIITIGNRTFATTSISPWSLFLPTTTTKMKNQSTPARKKKKQQGLAILGKISAMIDKEWTKDKFEADMGMETRTRWQYHVQPLHQLTNTSKEYLQGCNNKLDKIGQSHTGQKLTECPTRSADHPSAQTESRSN